MRIRAVAFDIDGTLYPNWQMFLASIPTFLLAPRAVLRFGRVRKEIRRVTYDEDLRSFQARLMARRMGCTREQAERLLERRFYDVWKWSYGIIRPYPYLRETIIALRGAGLKIGVLTDFPPERKLETLGVDDLVDTVVCAESAGYLKPHSVPFLTLAGRLALNPEEILYVGNNYAYDIQGGRAAGFKTAYIGRNSAKHPDADLYFTTFPGLREAVLQRLE